LIDSSRFTQTSWGRNPDPELKLVIKMVVRLFLLQLILHVLLIMANTSQSVVVQLQLKLYVLLIMANTSQSVVVQLQLKLHVLRLKLAKIVQSRRVV
jgi:hypothetical protein